MKDRRIKKTQKSIKKALLELMCEKEASHITVKELAERAEINRKTFYVYYMSLDDVFEQIEDELVARLSNAMEKYDFSSDCLDEFAFFSSLNHIINEDFDFYIKLIRANTDKFRLKRVKLLLKETFVSQFHRKTHLGLGALDLYGEFAASGLIAMYIQWLSAGTTISLDEFTITASKIAYNGINALKESP